MGIVSGEAATSILWHAASDLSGMRGGQSGLGQRQPSNGRRDGKAGQEIPRRGQGECRRERTPTRPEVESAVGLPPSSRRASQVKRPRRRRDDGHHVHLSAAAAGTALALDPRHAAQEVSDRFNDGR